MKNVTITLNEGVAQWARVEAAKAGKSLSRWIGDHLQAEMRKPVPATPEQMTALLSAIEAAQTPGISANLPPREELYDRESLRRHEPADLPARPRGARKAG
jgi:hypothetical protein